MRQHKEYSFQSLKHVSPNLRTNCSKLFTENDPGLMIRANQLWNFSQVPLIVIVNTGALSPGMSCIFFMFFICFLTLGLAPELPPVMENFSGREGGRRLTQRMSCPFNGKSKTQQLPPLIFPSLGIQSPCQMMIGCFFHLLRKVFRFYYFHYYSQKVIGFLGLPTIVLHKTITYPREKEKENHRLESAFKSGYEML